MVEWSEMSNTKKQKQVCKYFLQGTCKKGAQCSFRHENSTDERAKGLPNSIYDLTDSDIKVSDDDKAELASMMKSPPVYFYSSYGLSKFARKGIINHRDISPEEMRAVYYEAKDAGVELFYYQLEDLVRQDMLDLFKFIASDTTKAARYLHNENTPALLAIRYFKGDRAAGEQLRSALAGGAGGSGSGLASNGGQAGNGGLQTGPNAASPFAFQTPNQKQQQQQQQQQSSPAMFGNNSGNQQSAFGNNSNSASPFANFGNNNNSGRNSPFTSGSPAAFGSTTFGSAPATKLPPPPGQNAASAFGQTSAFGGFANKASPFSALASAASPSSAASSPASTPAFGQTTFGQTQQQQQQQAAAATPSRPFGSAFGSGNSGSAFGQTNNNSSGSAFGSFGQQNSTSQNNSPSTQSQSSAFGGQFGGANNNKAPAFGQTGFGQSPAFGAPSGFGSAPASNALAPPKSAFGANAVSSMPAFGKTGFGSGNGSASPFGSFASKNDGSGSGGSPFASFASGNNSSPFAQDNKGTAANSGSENNNSSSSNNNNAQQKPASPFATFNNNNTSAFGSTNNNTPTPSSNSAFGNTNTSTSNTSAFANLTAQSNANASPQSKPATPAFGSAAVGGQKAGASVFGSFGNTNATASSPSPQSTFGAQASGSSTPAKSLFGSTKSAFGSQAASPAVSTSMSTSTASPKTAKPAEVAAGAAGVAAGEYFTHAMQRFPLSEESSNTDFPGLPARPRTMIEQMVTQFAELGRTPVAANARNPRTGNSVSRQSSAAVYLPEISDLTETERKAFEGRQFEIGKVPEVLPPLQYI
ncbi:hypothetical protein BZA70DRAFT_292821 [Myxozyma melibiosi]|uniref:C3H1-type domain-containing protein n=1 Tax=Myxozyma melibiosi TaxID=54550 RepID=A0ABR1FC96_9ASCO